MTCIFYEINIMPLAFANDLRTASSEIWRSFHMK